MSEEIKFNITKNETEITVNVSLLKHPEHNTTDVVIEFPNGSKFITTVINREYEDEQRAQIGRTIYNTCPNNTYNKISIHATGERAPEQWFRAIHPNVLNP